MNNLQTYELKNIKDYCQRNCKQILLDDYKTNIDLYRGKYKGYAYGIKTTNYLLSQDNLRINKNELYREFKIQLQVVQSSKYKDGDFDKGVKDSLYKIMNFISTLK